MINLLVCFYGNDAEAKLWSEVLADLRADFVAPVFLGQPGRVPRSLSPEELIVPDNWDAIISEFQPSEKALEEYGKFTSASSFSEIMRIILKTMDRRDYSGTFRSLDQDVVARILFLFYMTKMAQYEIDGVIFDILPHTPDSMIVYQVAKFLKIPTLSFEICGVAPVRFPVTELASMNRFLLPKAGLSSTNFRNSETSSRISQALEARWGGFHQTAHVEEYISAQQLRSQRKAIYRASKWRSFFSRFGKNNGAIAMTFPGLNMKSRSVRALSGWGLEKLRRAALIQSINRATSSSVNPEIFDDDRHSRPFDGSFARKDSSEQLKGALFALHFEPESTCFPEGLPVMNQFDAVIEARRLLAPDRKLLVKEHPVQALSTNQGYMGRSPFFYSAVRGLRNTRMVPSQVSAKKLLDRVDVVFTLTGTVAFEGLALGKQVVYFGSPWWEGCPGTVKTFPGVLKGGSFPNFSVSAAEDAEVANFIRKRVEECGVFYPKNLENVDQFVQTKYELSVILVNWFKSVENIPEPER